MCNDLSPVDSTTLLVGHLFAHQIQQVESILHFKTIPSFSVHHFASITCDVINAFVFQLSRMQIRFEKNVNT